MAVELAMCACTFYSRVLITAFCCTPSVLHVAACAAIIIHLPQWTLKGACRPGDTSSYKTVVTLSSRGISWPAHAQGIITAELASYMYTLLPSIFSYRLFFCFVGGMPSHLLVVPDGNCSLCAIGTSAAG